jgi:hypothetical protein
MVDRVVKLPPSEEQVTLVTGVADSFQNRVAELVAPPPA